VDKRRASEPRADQSPELRTAIDRDGDSPAGEKRESGDTKTTESTDACPADEDEVGENQTSDGEQTPPVADFRRENMPIGDDPYADDDFVKDFDPFQSGAQDDIDFVDEFSTLPDAFDANSAQLRLDALEEADRKVRHFETQPALPAFARRSGNLSLEQLERLPPQVVGEKRAAALVVGDDGEHRAKRRRVDEAEGELLKDDVKAASFKSFSFEGRRRRPRSFQGGLDSASGRNHRLDDVIATGIAASGKSKQPTVRPAMMSP
jgi:hypothetical protein